MDIRWETRPTQLDGELATYASIQTPSNLRRRRTDDLLMVAAYVRTEDGTYKTSFLRPIRYYFNPPTVPLHTEKGARRRVRKYIELWAIAGYPTGE